jgi:tryptophan synthase alpha chain
LALAAGGATLLEVGIPYSDPVADGPVIQLAMERALAAKTTVASSLEIVRQIRAKSEVAMILFSYYNPIQSDLAQFLEQAKSAGADGVLIVDLPYEEADNYRHYCKQLSLANITVIAPSTTPTRMTKILAHDNGGFVYYACQKGTTGARSGLPADLPAQLAAIRQASQLPIAVGFGVSNSAMVNDILQLADGCVVGSYLVQKVAAGCSPQELTQFTKDLYHVA